MAKSNTKKAAAPKTATLKDVRKGATEVEVSNSGLEVWLYDDASLKAIREARGSDKGAGGMPPGFEAKSKKGLVIGYSLYQDDAVQLAVFVGAPLTEKELSASRFLEPQRAFLRLPSGRLCIESNDASRIGPEYMKEHAAKGGHVKVPPGDYRVTLYRIDHEALDREGLKWQGPQEIVVLTPGGSAKDAADGLLPFEQRRDTKWVGQFKLDGRRAEALVWFDDYWDTFTLNLNKAALKKLGVKPGTYIRTQVPATGLSLLTVVAESWEDAKRLPAPVGLELDEYGYGAVINMADWNSAEALFCKRDSARTRAEDKHLHLWLPAVVEVLDARPQPRTGPGPTPAQLEKKTYYDSGFLALVLCDVLPGVGDLDTLELPDALARLDKQFAKMGFSAQGDRCWQEGRGAQKAECCARFYAGLPDSMAQIWAGEGTFEVFFLSELDDATWVMTGYADEMEARIKRKGPTGLFVDNPRVQFETMDESLADIFARHTEILGESKQKPVPAPTDIEGCLAALQRFRKAAFE
jgi:hypothetical protein